MAHVSTLWQLEVLYRGEDLSDNEHAQGAPLDLRCTILISLQEPQRRKWQPTPVFLPGEFHGPRSQVGSSGIAVGLPKVGHD